MNPDRPSNEHDIDFLLAELEQDPSAPVDSTIRQLHAELETLADDLRREVDSDAFADELACRRVCEQVRQIARDSSSGARAVAQGADLPQARCGHYQLLELLGAGGMGAVYKALHSRLDKFVALKVLPADRLKSSDAIARFEREMKAVGRLDHPHIIRALDAGEADGMHFLVMEYVDGIDLSQLIKQLGPLPVAEACELVRQAAVGLQAAHTRGMVHRDIKPGNLMLASQEFGPPVVKVLDLGLALLSDAHAIEAGGITGSGQMMGTLDYMAPEQGGDSHTVDVRADIYSLGATLYTLLTSEPVYPGAQFQTAMQKLTALATLPAPPIQERRAEVPGPLAAVIHRMLAKNPADRFATPIDVAAALAPFSAGANLSLLLALSRGKSAENIVAPPPPFATPSASVGEETAATVISPTFAPHAAGPADPAAPTAVARRVASRTSSRGRRHLLLSVSLAGAALLAGIVLALRTPQGEIVVELGDGVQAEDVRIEVRGDGTLQVADARNGWTVDVKEGNYSVQLVGGADRFVMDRHAVTVTRGETPRVKVMLRPATDAAISRTAAKVNDYALQFVQVESKVELPINYDGSHPLTVELWCTPDHRATPSGQESRLMSVGTFALSRSAVRPEWCGMLWDKPNRRFATACFAEFRPIRTHLACQWDGDSLRLFVNGQPAHRSESNPESAARAAELVAESKLRSLWLGGMPWSDPQFQFYGAIDEIRVSNIARYSGAFMPPQRHEPDEHTIALYHCDEGDGDVLKDSSLNRLHGKIIGATWVQREDAAVRTSAALNQFSLQFDQPGSYVELPISYDGSHPLTIDLWCTPDRARIQQDNRLVRAGLLNLNLWGSQWCAFVWDEPNKKIATAHFSEFRPGRSHVACQWDGASFWLFVNGRPVPKPNVDPEMGRRAAALVSGAKVKSIWLGGVPFWAPEFQFYAEIDEIRVSNIARYSGAFTPPQRYEPDEHTIALYHCDEGDGDVLKDSSLNRLHGKVVGANWLRVVPPMP